MYPVLFRIPLDLAFHLGPLGRVPLFGFGILLVFWAMFGVWTFVANHRAHRADPDTPQNYSWLFTWALIAAGIAFGIPRLQGLAQFKDGVPIFGYGLMLFIGFTAASTLAAWRAQREGLSKDVIWDLAMWLFIPGIVGARLFYLIQYGDRVFAGVPMAQWPLVAVNLSQGGIVLYGALLGGAAGYFSFCYLRHIRPLGLADIVVPSVFVGIGFGRIGCFLYGCCYGAQTQLPWGVHFPPVSSAFQSMVDKHKLAETALCTPALHPTQIYSSIDGFMIALLTSWYFSRRRRNGEVLAVALIIYPITRFCMELLRADEGGQFGTALTISQWISIVLFIINIPFMYYLSQRPAVREPVKLPDDSAPLRAAVAASSAR